METGKLLSIIAGIITLVATYLFSWIAIPIGSPPTTFYSNGYGIIRNLPNMFTDADSIGSTLEIPGFAIYIIACLLIVFLASGVLQILGIKHRAFVAIGTFFSLGIAFILLFSTLEVIDTANWAYYILGSDEPIVEDIIPLKILGLDVFDIGFYLLYAGGFIGIVASVYGPGAF